MMTVRKDGAGADILLSADARCECTARVLIGESGAALCAARSFEAISRQHVLRGRCVLLRAARARGRIAVRRRCALCGVDA